VWARYAITGIRIPLEAHASTDGILARAGSLDRGDIVVKVVQPGMIVRDPLRFRPHDQARCCEQPEGEPSRPQAPPTGGDPPPPALPPGGVREPRRPKGPTPAGAEALPVPTVR
jgi:hypothetical protein